MVVDPAKVDPGKLVGLNIDIHKDFEGYGLYRGQVISCDKDLLGRDIFSVRYLDGDQEDLFLEELTACVKPDDLLLHINTISNLVYYNNFGNYITNTLIT